MSRFQGRFILISCVLLALCFLFVQGSPAFDELGCRTVEETGVYRCEVGSLAGREFSSKAEALESTQPSTANDHLKIISWNVKNLARPGSDYDRAAIVLADADLVVLQEMETDAQKGKGFLNVMADLVQSKSSEKICRAWTQTTEGNRLRYGFMWKDAKIGIVDSAGVIKEDCGLTALSIRHSKRSKLGVEATFFAKAQKQIFLVNSVLLDKKSKDPGKEIANFFAGLSESEWPRIVAGDLRAGAENAKFNSVRKAGFRSAIGKGKRSGNNSVENFWLRNAWPLEARTVNLFQKFPDTRRADIAEELSEQFPIMIEFSFNAEDSAFRAAFVPKNPKKKFPKPQREIASQSPPRKIKRIDPPAENLEQEASDVDAPEESNK